MKSNSQGYYRFPTIFQDKIVFVAEDDLWMTTIKGGQAIRLTANLGEVSHPRFSPDGKNIAFTGREEGVSEIYVMPAEGGMATRLTFQGAACMSLAWLGDKIIYGSNFKLSLPHDMFLFEIPKSGGEPQKLNYGPISNISFGKKGTVLGRYSNDLARWKRYRGGTAGDILIDPDNSGQFHVWLNLKSNLTNPMWIGSRIYFLSDHEGISNLYSATPAGKDIKKHTNHKDYYLRNASTDGKSIIYHAGGDLYVYDVEKAKEKKIAVTFNSPRIQLNRKFVDITKHLEEYVLSGDGSSILINGRGKAFAMGNWEGSVLQLGKKQGIRYRLPQWLKDQKKVLVLSDEGNLEHLEIHNLEKPGTVEVFKDLNLGRVTNMMVAHHKPLVALINNRNELNIVDLVKKSKIIVDQNKFGLIWGYDWSPDGRYLAYSTGINNKQAQIRIYDTETKKIHPVTKPILIDYFPVFDPKGKYLFFMSVRTFNPMMDSIQFEMTFPQSDKPYMITLQKETTSPFLPEVKPFKETPEPPAEAAKKDGKSTKVKIDEVKPVIIDFDGIEDRILGIPVPEGLYGGLSAAEDKIFYMSNTLKAVSDFDWSDNPETSTLMSYNFKTLESEVFLKDILGYDINENRSILAVRFQKGIRIVDTSRDAKQELPAEDKPGRKSGWIDISRIKLCIEPLEEWKQMYSEAWRLQREYYWVENMAGIDWKKIHDRYYPLIGRLGSRTEFSDLVWEMQGELGTSHCYEFGGDYKQKPRYGVGFLGADFRYDATKKAYKITHIVKGDFWQNTTPFMLPGNHITEGMYLLAINGEKLDANNPPEKILINFAQQEVSLTVADKAGKNPRDIRVITLGGENSSRYRDWVDANRKYVHDKTDGKIGYVHIPDMWVKGFSEFHRYFLQETIRDGLLVDVRFNGGGSVSQLLLEKLARKRIGYDLTRWFGHESYPSDSIAGPIIALTNEHAGSDGDIFSHAFKLMKLGKLVGKRTWGGVIGIWPRNWLVDGTITTQPEMSFWFKDVGWGVENYGTDPDIFVDYLPQDYAAGKDPQLDRTIAEIMKDLKKNPPMKPDFSHKPSRKLP
jgi:tricorn protease